MADETPTERFESLSTDDLREGIWRRAAADAARARKSTAYKVFAGAFAIAGAAIGALAPDNSPTLVRVGLAAAGAGIGLLGPAFPVFLTCLLRAPLRQRNEARAELLDLASVSLIAEPRVDVRDPADPESWAKIYVYNAQERGADRATARHVSPELVIRRGGEEIFRWKGWDTGAWRDFTTSQEEHGLWIAQKRRRYPHFYLLESRQDQPLDSFEDHELEVSLTLRGWNIERMVRTFRLTNDGAGHDLKLEDA